MALHTRTIIKLEDSDLCQAVHSAIEKNYNRTFIERKYQLTRRQLERIKQVIYSNQKINQENNYGNR